MKIEYEDVSQWTDIDKLKHIYIRIHDQYCPNNEYGNEDIPLHYDFSCEFLQDMIKKMRPR